MHTWLCCLTTLINRHDSSLLLRRKYTLEHEVGFKLHVSEIFILNFLFLFFPWRIRKNAVCHEQTQEMVQKQLCAQCHNCHFAHSMEDFGVYAVALAS